MGISSVDVGCTHSHISSTWVNICTNNVDISAISWVDVPLKKLDLKKKGKTKRKVEMKCTVDSPDAKVKWYKDGKEIKGSDPRYLLLRLMRLLCNRRDCQVLVEEQ